MPGHRENAESQGESNRALQIIATIDRGLGYVESAILAGCILLMALLMSLHVLGRILFDQGIPGTNELTKMLIIVITFIGIGYAARHARHINMSAIYDQLNGKARKGLLLVICIGTGLLMFYFAWKSSQYAVDIYGRGRVSSTLRIPIWIVDLALPVGFAMAGIQYTLTSLRNLMTPDIYRSFTEKEEYSDIPMAVTDDAAAETDADEQDNGANT